jgi:hypothetical protein
MKAGVDNLIEFKSGDAADFTHPALTAGAYTQLEALRVTSLM